MFLKQAGVEKILGPFHLGAAPLKFKYADYSNPIYSSKLRGRIRESLSEFRLIFYLIKRSFCDIMDSRGAFGVLDEIMFCVPPENRAKFWFCIADTENDCSGGTK